MLFFTPTKKGVQRLKTFIQKFSHVINGFLTGFDRIIFKGSVLAVMHENGAESFCALNDILNKDFKGWMLSRTADIVAGAQKLCMTQCGEGITHVNSSRLRKESLAHERQRVKGITSGLIGVWSAVESCVTFKASYDKVAGHPRLIRHWGKCKHLYFYYDHRQKKGDSPDAPKKLRALRKSVADVPLTSAKAAEVNERFMHQLAQCEDQTPASETFAKVCQAKQKSGKRVRALDLTGKDHALLKAIANPKFSISGITNKALRETLADAPGYAGKSEKQISAKITRHLRLLRDHGLIKKMPKQNRYYLTEKGRVLTITLNTALAASTQQLMKIAA